MCIHFHEDQGILYAGTTEPAGFAVLKSIGGVGSAKQNNAISAVVFPIIEKHLGIPGNRYGGPTERRPHHGKGICEKAICHSKFFDFQR